MSSNPREAESAIQLSIRPNAIEKRVRRPGVPYKGTSSRGGNIPIGVMLSVIQDCDIYAGPRLRSGAMLFFERSNSPWLPALVLLAPGSRTAQKETEP